MMLREPPLVEIADGDVFGPRLRDQLAQEDHLGADVVGDGGDVGRLQRERNCGNGCDSRRAAARSRSPKSLASVAEPPLPKMISLPPRATRSWIAGGRVADLFGLFARHLRAQLARRPATFIRMEAATSRDDVGCFLLFLAEKWIEKAGVADIVAQFAMLEEDVHSLPERVIENLDHLLVDERIVRGGIAAVGAAAPGRAKVIARALACRVAARPRLPGRLRADRSP